MNPETAVILPCLNEEATVAAVVADFQMALPEAGIFVFDNASTDRTAARAAGAGATVVPSPRRGKGHVIRHALRRVRADCLLIADGDRTYPAERAPLLVRAVRDGADMAVGDRLSGGGYAESGSRALHLTGNRLLTHLVNRLHGARLADITSGFRALSRGFADSLDLRHGGFEVEVEITMAALRGGRAIREIPVPYRRRPPGSQPKLRTVRDGVRIFRCVIADHLANRHPRA